jgi:hypothetical protein
VSQSGPPTPAAQQGFLDGLRAALAGVIAAEGLPTGFRLRPGLRLRRAYGRCRWLGDGTAELSVRCTADGDRARWRRRGAIVATLLHELAHLRYRHHGPRFWALQRRLLDRAAAAGVYDPYDFDPTERARGDEKLAGSAAAGLAAAARQARRARARQDRQALLAWRIGDRGRVHAASRALGGATVRVLGLGRTRLLVETAGGRRYRVPPDLVEHAV